MNTPSVQDVLDARPRVYAALQPSPLLRHPLLDAWTGCDTWVKHENHLPTGAFKIRGGLNLVAQLTADERRRGVVSASTGNHGQSMAFACASQGVPCRIFVPAGNNPDKNAAMRAFGATLVEHGEDFQESSEHAARLAAQLGLHRVPSYHRDLVRGVATGWLELFRAAPSLDIVFVPIGLGSGLCAAAAARAAAGSRARLVGVVSSHAPAYALSFEARRSVSAPVSTRLADGMACRVPDPTALSILLEHVDEVVRVTDDEVARAMKALYVDTHNVAEGAGAASLAAALQWRDARPAALAGRRVAVTLCGANVDHEVFAEVLRDTALD